MEYEFHESINPESIPKIKRAVAAHLVERPKGTLYMRVKLFTGKLVANTPLLGLLYEVECITVGGRVIPHERMILMYTVDTHSWVIRIPQLAG